MRLQQDDGAVLPRLWSDYVRVGQWGLARATIRLLHAADPDAARTLLRLYTLNPMLSQWFVIICCRRK